MGYKTTVIMQEDTAYGAGTFEFIKGDILPEAGIEMLDHIVYDVNTVDFSPIYNKIIKTNPDFIYIISSVKCVVPNFSIRKNAGSDSHYRHQRGCRRP